MTAPSGRSWGYWTRAKLAMLGEYLGGFATASRSQTERVYLDAFAGEGTGLDRLTGEEFHGSARIALEAGDGAGFTRFRFFELGRKAAELEARLRTDYPNRDSGQSRRASWLSLRPLLRLSPPRGRACGRFRWSGRASTTQSCIRA
ncbi:MAG: hypothetical protein QOK16_3828 [Solirubrobacteraceae bacterium]|jgi:hypothetical protein|nr:hypothetical protein [Solirubrobacteraceae bacterium]